MTWEGCSELVSRTRRRASDSVRPDPAGPTTSIGPKSCSTTRRWASVSRTSGPPSIAPTLAGERIAPTSMAPLADPTQKASAPAVGDALAADWVGACRRMVAAQRDLFQAYRGIAVRTVYEGMGEGGDRTLEIDRLCEEIVFEELDRLHAEGYDFTAISEERGEVALGDGSATARVVIDPIDG